MPLSGKLTNFKHAITDVKGPGIRNFPPFYRITLKPYNPALGFNNNEIKGALKAHKHISLYEGNTLQEQDATILFLSVIP